MSRRSGRRAGTLLIAALLVAAGCAGSGGEEVRGSEIDTVPPLPDEATVDTPRPAAPAPGVPSAQDPWTAGLVSVDHDVDGVAVLGDLRVGRNEGFDRVVFVFEEGTIPSYTVEYVDRPVRACGSGHVVEVAGDGWLNVRFTPARAYTEEGVATVRERDRRFDLPVIRQLRNTCDFEAHLEWVIGTGSPNRFRVLELKEPARVVVDIRH